LVFVPTLAISVYCLVLVLREEREKTFFFPRLFFPPNLIPNAASGPCLSDSSLLFFSFSSLSFLFYFIYFFFKPDGNKEPSNSTPELASHTIALAIFLPCVCVCLPAPSSLRR
jgi:hypothetical protein